MTDFWQDRIKNNPKLDISTVAAENAGNSITGSLDSGRSGDSAGVTKIDSMGKTRQAPKNEAPDWSA